MRCPSCGFEAIKEYQDFRSDTGGKHVVVLDVFIYKCMNKDCDMEWLPHSEEMRIDRALEKEGLNAGRKAPRKSN